MKELVFLLEEASAKAMLEGVLPRLLGDQVQTRMIVFEGKQDLEKQLVKRMRGYVNPRARFIVMRDQDNSPDCKIVKAKLIGLCTDAGKESSSLVRLACRELESFYLADLQAVEVGLQLQGVARQQGKARFRVSDQVISPSLEILKLTKDRYQKVSGSRQIGVHLDIENTRSDSFRNLIAGIRRLERELLDLPSLV
jgi:Domain of unknown function (DUF4276)